MAIAGICNVNQAQIVVGDSVPDFTLVDVHGNTHTLYNYLDEGKYVCIDFFGVDCDQCLTLVPTFNKVYTNYGCNTSALTFLAINYFNSNDEVWEFEEIYGGIYPAISGKSGGSRIYEDWKIQYWPQLWLISPNKTLVSVISPITAQNIDSVLLSYNISKDSCPAVSVLNNTYLKRSFEIFPNPASSFIVVKNLSPTNNPFQYYIYNSFSQLVKSGIANRKSIIDVSKLTKGVYILRLKSDVFNDSNKLFIKI
jgi:thiol-disulfide isomerase/thioredoxin